jgi:hypothetical protein
VLRVSRLAGREPFWMQGYLGALGGFGQRLESLDGDRGVPIGRIGLMAAFDPLRTLAIAASVSR